MKLMVLEFDEAKGSALARVGEVSVSHASYASWKRKRTDRRTKRGRMRRAGEARDYSSIKV